jgi:hypothetical protein
MKSENTSEQRLNTNLNKLHSKSDQDFVNLQKKDLNGSNYLDLEENQLSKKELNSINDINLYGLASRKGSSFCRRSNNTDNLLVNGVNYNLDYSAFPTNNSNIIRLTRQDSNFLEEFNKKRMERETSL